MLNKNEVKHIAALARIGLSGEEVDKFSHDLSSILDWIGELEKADIEKAEECSHITGLKNVYRRDKAVEFENKDGIKKLFPEEKNGYDKVKSVL